MTHRSAAPRPPLAGVEPIYEDDSLRVSRSGNPDAEAVTLCFTGLQQQMGGMGPEEFVGSSRLSAAAAIFVTDKTKSWFNSFTPERVLDVLAPHIAGRRINTLGNSMGGFGAIWITRYLPVSAALAFAPQFSVHPDIVPDETRWPVARARIASWRYPSLDGHFMPDTRYVTISGNAGDEVQWKHFPRIGNARHYVMLDADHLVAATLKQRGVLQDVIAAALIGDGDVAALLDPVALLLGSPAD